MSEYTLFVEIAKIIIAATITSLLLKRLNQPNLFAYIIAGIIIGPLFFGAVEWNAFGIPMSFGIKSITSEIALLSQLGAAFLLFTIGIETSIERLVKNGRPLVLGTLIQAAVIIAATLLLTFGAGFLPFETALFTGVVIAFSSTMVVIKLLADQKKTNTLEGRIIISILLIQDFLVVLIVPLLQNISMISNPFFFIPILAKSLALVAVALLANKFIFPKLFNAASKENETFFLASISTAFLFIGVSFLLDVPITIGAFIGGLAISNLPYNSAIFSKVRALRDFFLTIFFVSLGAQLTFGFGALSPQLMFLVFLLIFVLKPLVFFVVSLLSGYGSRLSMEAGIMLAQVSEFGFIIASLGASTLLASGAAAIPADLFSFLVAMTAFSIIITPYLMGVAPRVSNSFSSKINAVLKKFFGEARLKHFNRKIDSLRTLPEKKRLRGHIIVVGGGFVGRAIAKKLKHHFKVLIVDSDPEVVMQGQKDKLDFVYGTADDAELLEHLDFADARSVIITMTSHSDGVAFMKAVRRISRKPIIFALSKQYYNAVDFYNNGADYVSIPYFSGIGELCQKIASTSSKKRLFLNSKTRRAYFNYLKEQAAEEAKYLKKIIA